jgi:CDP-diacylglycerol---glycerol-3-phosphate 3-phosphatidyltransferase
MARRLRQELTNVPNLLTYARIAVIPLLLWLVAHDSPKNCMWAAVLYTVAAITDLLDGFLARIWNQVSMVGKFLDPLADKLYVMLLMLALIPMGRMPQWVLAVTLTRELAVTGLRAMAAGEGLIISASDNAKMKTIYQMTGNVCLLIHYRYALDLLGWKQEFDFHGIGMAFVYLSLVLSVYSGVSYFIGFLAAIDKQES